MWRYNLYAKSTVAGESIRPYSLSPLSKLAADKNSTFSFPTPVADETTVSTLSVTSVFLSSSLDASSLPPRGITKVIATTPGDADGAMDGVGDEDSIDAGVLETDTVVDGVLSGGGRVYEIVGFGVCNGVDDHVCISDGDEVRVLPPVAVKIGVAVDEGVGVGLADSMLAREADSGADAVAEEDGKHDVVDVAEDVEEKREVALDDTVDDVEDDGTAVVVAAATEDELEGVADALNEKVEVSEVVDELELDEDAILLVLDDEVTVEDAVAVATLHTDEGIDHA